MASKLGSRVIAKPDDHHALPSMIDPHTRAASRVCYDDLIETSCPACTLIWKQDRWRHDRACPFRQSG